MSFSPKCEIDDYIKYLKLKSKLTWDESLDDFVVKGTNVKHVNILRRFLIFIHHKDIPKVKLEYYKTPRRVDINPYPKLPRKKYISTIPILSWRVDILRINIYLNKIWIKNIENDN